MTIHLRNHVGALVPVEHLGNVAKHYEFLLQCDRNTSAGSIYCRVEAEGLVTTIGLMLGYDRKTLGEIFSETPARIHIRTQLCHALD